MKNIKDKTETLVDITSDYSYILPEICVVLDVNVNNVWVYNHPTIDVDVLMQKHPSVFLGITYT